jgi:hypothetical protein
MTDLATENHVPVRADAQPLAEDGIAELLAAIPGWSVVERDSEWSERRQVWR